MVGIQRSDVPHVYTDGRNLYTVNLDPGVDVYGEPLIAQEGVEYRRWDPTRSKLAALLKKGAAVFPFTRRSDVLYLGAAQGTTVSHLSDICADGTVYAVEVSRRAFQKLLSLSERRPNVMPILGDATRPEAYAKLVPRVNVLYQDVAQRDQAGIFLGNLPSLAPNGLGILMVKARSVDVAAKPRDVYADVRRRLEGAGLHVVQLVDLGPFERDHAAVVVERA